MKCKEIIGLIEEQYPVSCAEDWDNPGLIAGDDESEVNKILVALDATDEVIEQACLQKAELLITHHPMIFGSVKQINNRTVTGRRILKLIRNGVSCYAMHTNFDVRGMAKLNEEQLGLRETEPLYPTGENDGYPEGIGRIGYLAEPISYTELAELVKKAMGIDSVRCYGRADKKIGKAAVCGGSGRSMVSTAIEKGADVLITGDIDYHTGLDAYAEGLLIIDAGHFGTEHIFSEFMTKELKKLCPKCKVTAAVQTSPFTVV